MTAPSKTRIAPASLLASLLLAGVSHTAAAQDTAPDAPARTPMSAQDLVTMPRLGAPVVTADGRYAVYPVTHTDGETYKRTATAYWRDLYDADAEPVALDLDGDAYDFTFAPDGTLYFLSDRQINSNGGGYSRLWRATISAQGKVGAISFVLDAETPLGGYKLSPDASKLVVWADAPRGCTSLPCHRGGFADTPYMPGPGTGRLYEGDKGFIRHWDSWETPGTYSRLFAFEVPTGFIFGGGTALDGPVGEGALVGDTPTQPFGDGGDVAWAADSSGIWFVSKQADATEPLSTNTDIFWSDLTAAAPTNITEANAAYDTAPTPSPDGRKLAWLAMARPGYESDRLVVQLRDLRTGLTEALTQDFDRSFGTLAWTPDSRYLIATAQDVLDTPAFRIDPRNGTVERLDLMAGDEAHIGNVMPLADNRLLFTRDAISGPSELYLSTDYATARPLTDVGASILGQRSSVMTQRFSFAGAGGDTVWGQITRPEATGDAQLPAILYVHGGPQGSFNDSWSSRWNPRVLASQGYAVISVDFHGSTGYGQDFTDAIRGHWGGKPLEDLQLGLAAALAKDAAIDGTRACAMGASYGGYMMNWIAGQWPDRFRCLVQHDGLFDMRSFYYTTEELWFPRWDFMGSYAENTALYERWNPVNHVDKWRTPMLVVAGEQDFRVPYTQGLASFTALQERNIPSQFLFFPDENHWVLKPKNSLQWHRTVFGWLDRWLTEDPAE